jgi:hypothetical protein
LPLEIEQLDFLEMVCGSDLLQEILIHRLAAKELVDEPGVIEEALADLLFEEGVPEDRVFNKIRRTDQASLRKLSVRIR